MPSRLFSAAATGLLASVAFAATAGSAWAEPKVVASIKPIQSLVAGVMEGVGEPELLVQGAGSPHGYQLKPSQAASLSDADIVFWVGPELETFLRKPLETLAAGAQSIPLDKTEGLKLMTFKEGHDHDHGEGGEHASGEGDHDHDHKAAEADHDHDHEAGHEHEDHAEGEEGHHHAAGSLDPHIWLDPDNAKVMVGAIETTLAKADPDNAETYKANAEKLDARLDKLTADTEAALAPVRGKPFIVFHDGYQYFEDRFDIHAAAALTVSPELSPGAERVAHVREEVVEEGALCVFAEPQFEPRLVSTIIEGTKAKSGTLDPLGASLTDGPDLYFELIHNLSSSLVDCLGSQS
ncbi:MAG: zinc ABC transporter substrate-binding protein [Fulvimarina manganoxydans]|uniref:zinc ABC transporter substrate-binding protein n=1 Tax=Fulvimarina manganoxydans TaxID=937218 RepID=UPI0023531E1F|nr:zinc ABC transporter substrate-binding protein [Fulvimarina manganoxydans]MCK5933623.1 zinc ABC transporter substrate-binding protein [Fulvimarina manganoxydans]